MKRLFDIVASLFGLILLSPVIAIVAWQISRKLGSPVLFRQVRPGKDGKPFEMVKFRSMRDALDAEGNPLPDSERMTPFGSFLRSSSLDELPGLWNVHEWLAGSSVFVLPSYREGVPRSTQEAMAIGRAIITTDVPGCRETVVDGVNGFFVPPWSSEALAEKMILFIEQPELIEQMGKESYRIAQEKFDAHEVNQRLITMLLN